LQLSLQIGLQLGKIFSSRNLKNSEYKHPAHDGMLFIIVHQVYELWFKQILHELDSVVKMVQENKVDEKMNRVFLLQYKVIKHKAR